MQIRDVPITSQEAVTEESIVGDAKETVVQYSSKKEIPTVRKKVLKTSIVRAYSSRKGDYIYPTFVEAWLAQGERAEQLTLYDSAWLFVACKRRLDRWCPSTDHRRNQVGPCYAIVTEVACTTNLFTSNSRM